jgi:hypothetical protein
MGVDRTESIGPVRIVINVEGSEADALHQIRRRFPQFAPVLDSALGYFEPGGAHAEQRTFFYRKYYLAARCPSVQLVPGLLHHRIQITLLFVEGR